MPSGFHAEDTRGIADIIEDKNHKRLSRENPHFNAGYNLVRDTKYSEYTANIQLIRKILQSRGSSLRLRGHKCLKSGDAHLYLLQDDCDIGRLIWLVIY